MADIAPGRDQHFQGSQTGIIHNPASEWSKAMRKWEATYTEHGPGERPYVKREYPTYMFLWGQYPAGGVGILESVICETETQRAPLEARGFRCEPLDAQKAFDAQQLEYAKLHAEREWEKRHRLSPKAVAEVEAVEAERGSSHLPTIAEAPRRRGRKPTVDPEERAVRSVET